MAAVGMLSVELHFDGARSLKDKRRSLGSIKDRLRKLNVAVAELDHHDLHQRARLGIVAVATARDGVDRLFESVLTEIDRRNAGAIVASDLDWLT